MGLGKTGLYSEVVLTLDGLNSDISLYFYSPLTVSSELTTQMCPTERERPQTDQLPRKYLLSFFFFFFFFLLTFILKIQRSTIKTGSAVACISAQANLSFGYKAKD